LIVVNDGSYKNLWSCGDSCAESRQNNQNATMGSIKAAILVKFRQKSILLPKEWVFVILSVFFVKNEILWGLTMNYHIIITTTTDSPVQ